MIYKHFLLAIQYATSTRNQRLKKFRFAWWISLFKDMESKRLYKSYLDTHHTAQIERIFSYLEFSPCETIGIGTWRKTGYSLRNAGQNRLYKQGTFFEESDISVVEQVIGIKHCPVWKNEDMYELLDCYCQIHSVKKPTCAEEGIDLYVKLLSMLQIDGFEV